VTSTLCSICKLTPGQYYNPDASSTYDQESSSLKTLKYGSATLEGYYATDTVCLDKIGGVCVDDFEFFVIEQQSGLDNADGILGLSPDETTANLSYIRSLASAGVIDKELFTFWINFNDVESSVTLGGIPANSTRGETYKQSLVTRYDTWWTVSMNAVRYAGTNIHSSSISYAILDTGTSLLYIGESDYINFITLVMKEAPTMICNDVNEVFCYSNQYTCDYYYDQLSDFEIRLGNTYYTIPPQGYTFSGDGRQ